MAWVWIIVVTAFVGTVLIALLLASLRRRASALGTEWGLLGAQAAVLASLAEQVGDARRTAADAVRPRNVH